MELIDLTDFADGGLIREASFRERLAAFDLESLRDRDVLIKGCGATPIPTWAFMMIVARAAQVAKSIQYGEEARPMLLFDRAEEPVTSS